MSIFDNGFKLGTGLTIGLASVILAPVVIPMLAEIARPVAKAAIKGGILVYDKGRRLMAGTTEKVGDLAAAAKEQVGLEHPADTVVEGDLV